LKLFARILFAVAAAAALTFAQGLRYEPPVIDGHEPPFQSSYNSPFTNSNPAILKNNGKMFSDTAVIDFEKRQLTFLRQDGNGNSVWSYHYGELSDYISDSRSHSFYEEWYNKLTAEAKKDLGAPAAPKLQWELAVHYPPWAQRLLGNTPPRLKIEGRLELTVAYDYTKTWTSKEDEITDIIPLDVVTNYEFSINGSVGRLISVSISHSKQDGFDLSEDPLKNFKVEYKESEPGELEDEIIQEIVAGYTGFDMPGTNLSGYSEKHDGLFGIKVRAKLGPLMLTAVASHAQGEALTKELGGKNDPNSMTALRETEFIKNRYFFLDTRYKNYYNEINSINNPNRNAEKPPRITQFQAFVSINCNETAQSMVRRYKVELEGVGEVCVRMLNENTEYTVDVDRGYVRFEYNVKDDEIVAIAMTTVDGSLNRGTIVPGNAGNDSYQKLEMLKPRNMEELTSADKHFGLMWRNVYYLSEIEDGKLDLFYLDPAQGDTIRHTPQGSRLISEAMGLTDGQGRARVENVEIYNLTRQELVIPPWKPEPNGNEPFANTDLGSMADSSIYRIGSRTTTMSRDYVSKFGILTNGSTRRNSYDNLGWNILEGTVTVKTNSGTVLVEGEDYELDYQMGVLDLISTRARSAESIFITYQRESDFVLEKKVFAGLRGEVRLPFISDNSFMAASVLYQNAATSAEDIPQLGNEPFSKLHLSFNTSLDLQPEWMTKAVNALPLVKTEEESAAKIDFEVVHSRMNQNTSKEKSAYLDDFERTKDGYSLSLRHQSWHPSHYPFKYTLSDNRQETVVRTIQDEMLEKLRIPAWNFYWYTPSAYDDANRINRFSVWTRDPNNSRTNTTDTYIDVLRLHATPASGDHPDGVVSRFRNSYASVTTSFGKNGINMENHHYLEFVVNPRGMTGSGGRKGKLMVQIGTFSHDQVRDGGPPNGRFDLEDSTYQNRPELLPQFDKGLNRLDAANKFYVIPNADRTGWDTLSRTQRADWLVSPRSFDNPSGDLYRKYDRDNLTTFRFVNGTWNNSLYDSENIDNDGIPRVNISEAYYTYEIDLDRNSDFIDRTSRVVEHNGWRFYRIPIKDFARINNDAGVALDSAAAGGPDWSKMRGMRLVWYDFEDGGSNNIMLTRENELWIAGLELVGNYWEPAPGSEGRIEATSISNYEDVEYNNSVWQRFVKPKAGEVTPEERSLRLRVLDMPSDTMALVRKNMSYYPQNVSGYDSISIQVYSKARAGGLRFVLRFGSDDSTYYEYSAPMSLDSWNRYAFSLQDLSDLKQFAERGVADSGRIENAAMPVGHGQLRVVAPRGKRPNFTAITFMAVGVSGGPVSEADECVIWVNELLATGARALTGIAARVNLATQWADFLSLSAGISYTDGDFRTMTDVSMGNENRSELTANLSAKMRLDKFLPEEWGVSIPVGGSVSGGLSRPTVKPQSDIMLFNDDGNPDGFFDMAGDAFNMMLGSGAQGDYTRAQEFETFTTSRNAFTSFEKTGESENPLIGFTLDRIKTDVSYNMTASVTSKGQHADSDSGYYIRTDTTVTYAGNLRYDLSPRNPPEWTSATPFSEAAWAPSIYKKYKFNLLPSTINFDLAEVQHRTEKRNDPKLNVYDFTTRTFDMRHGVRVEYTPIDPLLNLSYSTRFDRDLSNLPTRNDVDLMLDSTFANIFGLNDTEGEVWDRYGMLYGERGRTQSASAKLTPQFVRWMTHSAEYSADYTGQVVRRDNDDAQYLNAGVATALRFRNTLLLSDLFKAPPANRAQAAAGKAAADTSAKGKPPAQTGFMAWIGGGVNKIAMRSINFEYDVMTDLKNNFLSSNFLDSVGMNSYEFFKYQLGLRRGFHDYMFGHLGDWGLGSMNYRRARYQSLALDPSNSGYELYRFDQSKGSWAARFSSAFTIPDPFKISFTSVSFGWGREFQAQPDTAFIDTTVVMPEARASANTEIFTKLPFVKAHMSKLGATTSASYKRSRKESRDRTDTTTTLEFQPLVSLEGKFIRWPSLSANYRFGLTNTQTVNGGKGEDAGATLSSEDNTRTSHTLTAAYEFKGGGIGKLQEIRIRKWVIPIEGKASVGLGVNWENSLTRTHKIGDGDDELKRVSDFNYSPFLDYRFTENIKGQARYIGSHKNQDGRRTTNQRFQLTAEVVF